MGGGDWLAPSEWRCLALTDKSFNQFSAKGPPKLSVYYRQTVYRTISARLYLFHNSGGLKDRVYDKIFKELKFYQVASLIDQYDAVKRFGLRYFCREWVKATNVPNFFYKVAHLPSLLLASYFQPGNFWKVLNSYIFSQIFLLFPKEVSELSALEQKILVRYFINRGLPIPGRDIFCRYRNILKAVKSLARLWLCHDMEAKMKGYWCHLHIIIPRHETCSHVPLTCKEMGCRNVLCNDRNWMLLPDTTEMLDGQVLLDEIVFSF